MWNARLMPQARTLLGIVVAAVPLLMVVITCDDVIGRRIDRPLPGAIEMIELLMGVLVFGALPMVTADREHVTVGLFDGALGKSIRLLRDRVVNIVSAAVVAVIAWRLFAKAIEMAKFGDASNYLGLPLAPLAFFMAAMTAVTVCALVLHAVRTPGARS